jgi:hypothetical protein
LLAGGGGTDEAEPVRADRLAKAHILFRNRVGIGEAGSTAFSWRQGQEMPPHCLERPLQIDGCRPCRAKSGAGRLEIGVGRLFTHCKRQAIGRSHTDERRATDLHILDGACRLRHGGDRNDFEFMRQPRLIDDLDARPFVVQPNGSKNPASDPHESAPSPCLYSIADAGIVTFIGFTCQ